MISSVAGQRVCRRSKILPVQERRKQRKRDLCIAGAIHYSREKRKQRKRDLCIAGAIHCSRAERGVQYLRSFDSSASSAGLKVIFGSNCAVVKKGEFYIYDEWPATRQLIPQQRTVSTTTPNERKAAYVLRKTPELTRGAVAETQ